MYLNALWAFMGTHGLFWKAHRLSWALGVWALAQFQSPWLPNAQVLIIVRSRAGDHSQKTERKHYPTNYLTQYVDNVQTTVGNQFRHYY